MNAKFIVNDYVLIWNLLFGTSISETIYKLKQRIWDTYKKEYRLIVRDKEKILKDYKNFIPDDDTVYNIILENKSYELLKKETEKYRIEVMRIWDKNKKETEYLYKNIFRKKISDAVMFVVNKDLNIIEYNLGNNIIIGKEIDRKNPIKVLLEINMDIVNNNIKKYQGEQEKIKQAIIEFTILNEYATRLTKQSCYYEGNEKLKPLKRFLYPYWLMYLGVPQNDFEKYMRRDKIIFDSNKYAYEKELKKMNIEEFIDFCIRNQRYMIRKETKEEIETL